MFCVMLCSPPHGLQCQAAREDTKSTMHCEVCLGSQFNLMIWWTQHRRPTRNKQKLTKHVILDFALCEEWKWVVVRWGKLKSTWASMLASVAQLSNWHPDNWVRFYDPNVTRFIACRWEVPTSLWQGDEFYSVLNPSHWLTLKDRTRFLLLS